MEDESKNEHGYDMQESVMSKSKGIPAHGASYPRQSTFLQDSGSKIKILESSSTKTLKVAWNPKNHLLAFGGDKESAYLWDMDDNLENAERVNTLPHITPDTSTSSMTPEKTIITSIDWKPDGNMFITAATDGICRLWSAKGEASAIMYNEIAMPLKNKDQIGGPFGPNGTTESLQNNQISQGDVDSISDCKWNKDGSAIVTVSEKNNVILWNTEGKLRASYQGHTYAVEAVDWKNNNMFATASKDGVVKIWDVQSSSAIKTYNAHEGGVR
jgi:WD40 repeat protein